MSPRVRPFEERDTPRLVEILGSVFSEYGMRFDPGGYDRDVYEVARRYEPPLGAFLSAEDGGEVVGFGGADVQGIETAEIHRLYLDPRVRGRGLGKLLVASLEEWARPRARTMTLWSDVRFAHAHELYARLGYRLVGQRTLEDPDRSSEFGFRRRLTDRPDDRPFVPELGEEAPLESLSPEERQRASMIAGAILDTRTLPRLPDGGHVLPDPRELFPGEPGPVLAVFQRPRIMAGFRAGSRRRLHPLFAGRIP
jgi:putative acetyltransferase